MKIFIAYGNEGEEIEEGVVGKQGVIDDEYFFLVEETLWRLYKGYAVTIDVKKKNKKGKPLMMSLHRTIASFAFPDVDFNDRSIVVRFKNGNKMDCRVENLIVGRKGSKSEEEKARYRRLMEKLNKPVDEESLREEGSPKG